MAFCQLQCFSDVLGKQTTTWILLPEKLKGPFKTYYLLHGLSDDHTIWLRRTRIESYVDGKPLIVVMADGGKGFYTNHNNGPRWAEHIGGLSMGGYGALRVGLGFPDRFSSLNSHSGAVMFGSKPQDFPDRMLMVGANPAGSEHDVLVLAKKAKAAKQLPRILIDCGTEDFLLEDNRALHRSFLKMKIPHKYAEHPGNHNWDYWDLHVREAIAFHLGKR